MTAIKILTEYYNIQFHAKNKKSGSDMVRDYVWLYNYTINKLVVILLLHNTS